MIGSPVSHSLSPVLHRAAYRSLGLSWTYDACDVTAEQLFGFMAGLDTSWRGLSVTMPLKQAMIDHCDRVQPLARTLGVVNTVVVEPDGSRVGFNTDVPGLVAALHAGLDAAEAAMPGSAVVVGAGATSRSALAALASIGVTEVTVLARASVGGPALVDPALVDLAAQLGLELHVGALSGFERGPRADVVVSTVPIEAQRGVAEQLAGLAPTVLDVVYNPPYTPLLIAAERAGGTTIGGFELLLHQAARQVELMTGVAFAPLDAIRSAGLRALAERR